MEPNDRSLDQTDADLFYMSEELVSLRQLNAKLLEVLEREARYSIDSWTRDRCRAAIAWQSKNGA
jgi:hypothetical protein